MIGFGGKSYVQLSLDIMEIIALIKLECRHDCGIPSIFFPFFPFYFPPILSPPSLPPFFFLFLFLGSQNSFEKGLSKVFARWKILEASKLSSKTTALDMDSLRSNCSVFSVVVKLKTSFKNSLLVNSWKTAFAGYLQICTNHPQI